MADLVMNEVKTVGADVLAAMRTRAEAAERLAESTARLLAAAERRVARHRVVLGLVVLGVLAVAFLTVVGVRLPGFG